MDIEQDKPETPATGQDDDAQLQLGVEAPDAESSEPESQPEVEGPSAGAMLREGRAARNRSVAQLAAETRIPEAVIQALEEDRDPPDQIPVYIRGYYRRCAHVLGLPEDEVVAAYVRRSGALQPAVVNPEELLAGAKPHALSRPRARVRVPGAWWILLVIIAITVGVVVAVAMVRNAGSQTGIAKHRDTPVVHTGQATTSGASAAPHSGGARVTASKTALVTAPLLVVAKPMQDKQPRQPATRARASAPSGAAAKQVAAGNSVATVSATTPASEKPSHQVATPTSGQAMVLKFSGDCWVKVTDASGALLLQQRFNKGQTQVVKGLPPYHLVLGNAAVVKLTFAGQPVDFSSRRTPNSRTARFDIPLH